MYRRRHTAPQKLNRKPQRIGIYAGTFNPVHAGHLAFALQAVQAANLDKLYFVPERQPRGKRGVEHFGHRVAMLRRAIQPHPQFGVLETVDVNLTVVRTLPKLQQIFSGDQLIFLFGSDAVASLPVWPQVEQLLKSSELIIGMRSEDARQEVRAMLPQLTAAPRRLTMFDSYAPHVSSRTIREALYRRRPAQGLLRSVQHYSNRHWLYVSVS